MIFEPRLYPDIVRDLLTTVTGGTVREPVLVPAGDEPIVLDRLAERPIRRVSHLEGVIDTPTVDDPTRTIPYRFTAADFELVAAETDGEFDAIRFREDGRRPPPGSMVTVNYYPVQVGAVPLTDLNVGSVVRTLLETVARELALEELHLEHVYHSAYLETAEATSLDRVVALVGVTRIPSGHPTVKVRFSRASGSTGRITVPTGTVATDAADNRYATLATLILEPGEPSREVLCGGLAATTKPVEAGAIDRLEVLVAGVSSVTNESSAYRSAASESDEDLRRRARGALHVSGRGTIDAIRFGVLSIPGVKDVTIVEEPFGVPGEIRVDVAYEQEPDPDLLANVRDRIDDLRAAGIRVLVGQAARLDVAVTARLTLAGGGVPAAELTEVTAGVEARLAEHLRSLAPGGVIRSAKLVSLTLEDERIVDAEITLNGGAGDTASLTLGTGTVAEPLLPFTFPQVKTEDVVATEPATTHIDILIPLHLQAGITEAGALDAIRAAVTSHLATPPNDTLTVDGLVSAARDETRYVIVRESVLVTVEADGRFLQLTDGIGSHRRAEDEKLKLQNLDLQVEEGEV